MISHKNKSKKIRKINNPTQALKNIPNIDEIIDAANDETINTNRILFEQK